jgi:hypothetical protein
MHIILSLIVSAHAGVVGDLCARCLSAIENALVADDPDEFRNAQVSWVIRSFEQLVIAKHWRSLNKYEQSTYDRLKRELEFRRTLGSDSDRDLADEALIRLAR